MKKSRFILAGLLALVLTGCGGNEDYVPEYEEVNPLAYLLPTPPPTTAPAVTEPIVIAPPVVTVPDGFEIQTPWVSMLLEPDPRQSIAATAGTSFAIDRYGVLWAWGIGFRGQMGLDFVNQQLTPARVMEGAVAVSARSNATVAVSADGGLYQWGDTGPNYRPFVRTPYRIGNGMVWASTHIHQSRTISSSGEAFVWRIPTPGRQMDVRGQAFNSYPMDRPANLTIRSSHYGARSFAEIQSRTYVVMHNNSLYYWGYGYDHMVHVLDDIEYVFTGQYADHVLALGLDGRLWAWGSNYYGQIGAGFGQYVYEPTVIANGVIDASISYAASAIIDSSGRLTLRGWWQEHIGNEAILENAVLVYMGMQHGLVVTADGGLYTFGFNSWGQLGNGYAAIDNSPDVPNEELEFHPPFRVLENMR